MTEKSKVYYGSVIAGKPERFVNPSVKLDKILEHLDFGTIEKKDKVAIKMHLGFNDGYQTIPVFFVRRIAKAIKELGAFPFVTDNPTAVYNAAERGYTSETCGCPLIPIAGVKDGYTTKKEIGYKGVDELDAAGVLLDADVLINLSHTKGHGACGYGGAFKNLALGGYSGPSRWTKIHGVEQYDAYFDKEKMTKEHILKLREACPRDAPTWSEQRKAPVMAFYACDQCHGAETKPCEEADAGHADWKVKEENFDAFQELMAHATKAIIDTFDKEKLFHINVMMDITPYCDCMGMGMPQVIPDIGIAGSRDIVAIDYASLDLIKQAGLIESVVKQIPDTYMRINPDLSLDLHPFQLIHGPLKNPYKVADFGEAMGLGSRDYELIEILSPAEAGKLDGKGHTYEGGATFF